MKIVALSGWKGSGKDMLARHLVESHGFKRLAFADPLKDMASKEYGIPRAHFDDPAFKEKPILSMPVNPIDSFSLYIHDFLLGEFRRLDGTPAPGPYIRLQGRSLTESVIKAHGQLYWTPRAVAIFKGSGNRALLSSYWVQKAVLEAEKFPNGLFVISDLRFKSESQQLIDFAGKESITFIRVERLDLPPSEDPSERDLDDFLFDAYVQNKSSKRECFRQLERALGLDMATPYER